MITDIYGRIAIQTDDGIWVAGGLTIGPCSPDQARITLDGMAPDGWLPPVAERPAPDPTITRAQLDAVLSARGLAADQIDALFAACAGAVP